MKLDLSKQPHYWPHRKFNNPNTRNMPLIYLGAAVLGLILMAIA